MTGVDIIGARLSARASLLAMVPLDRIKGGALPDGIVLPALLVRSVSLVERQSLKRGEMVRVNERVSVTVRAASYDSQRFAIIEARNACAGWTGNLGDARGISILSAGTGPDMRGPGESFEQAQDFLLSFDRPA